MKSGQNGPIGDPELFEEVGQLADMFKERMLGRAFTVGSNPVTAPVIETSYTDTLVILEKHLKTRDFLFGQ